MTDELSIQQQKQPMWPTALGAIAGGAGAYAGLTQIDKARKLVSDPAKYNSYEDIIKESEDKFTKSVQEATGEEKALMEKAAEARKAGVDAGEAWQKEFEAFKATKAPELAEGHELLTQKAEKEALIKSLEAENGKAVETVANGTKEVTTTVEGALNKKAKSYYNAVSKLENLIASNAPKAEIEAQRNIVQNIESNLNKYCEEVASKLEYKGEEKQIAKAKERVAEKFKNYINERKEYFTRRDATAGHPKVVKTYLQDIAKQETSKNNLTKLFDSLSEATGKNVEELYSAHEGDAKKFLERVKKLETNKLNALTSLQEKFAEAVSNQGKEVTTVKLNIKDLLKETGKAIFKGTDITIAKIVKESGFSSVEEFIATLSEKEKQLLNGEVTKESVDKLVKTTTEKVSLLESAPQKLSDLTNEIRNGRNSIEADMRAIEEAYGKGAFVKDGVLYVKDGKKTIPYKPNKNSVREPKLGNMPKGTTIPKGNIKIEVPTFTTVEKVAESVESEALKTARQELSVIEEKILAERLKQAGVTDEKALIEEFAKTGKGTKEEAIKKAQDVFKKDLKALFEGKLSNWKLAVGAGIGVGLGALIGKMLTPSGDKA